MIVRPAHLGARTCPPCRRTLGRKPRPAVSIPFPTAVPLRQRPGRRRWRLLYALLVLGRTMNDQESSENGKGLLRVPSPNKAVKMHNAAIINSSRPAHGDERPSCICPLL